MAAAVEKQKVVAQYINSPYQCHTVLWLLVWRIGCSIIATPPRWQSCLFSSPVWLKQSWCFQNINVDCNVVLIISFSYHRRKQLEIWPHLRTFLQTSKTSYKTWWVFEPFSLQFAPNMTTQYATPGIPTGREPPLPPASEVSVLRLVETPSCEDRNFPLRDTLMPLLLLFCRLKRIIFYLCHFLTDVSKEKLCTHWVKWRYISTEELCLHTLRAYGNPYHYRT